MIEKKEIVRNGYDKIAREYQANRHIFTDFKITRLREDFSSYLPRNATILDVGCGAGPFAKLLVQAGFDVVGVDFSASMLGMSRKNVPEAALIKGDLTELGFRDSSFDGLVALYSIIHIPREMHASLYRSFHRILKPDGMLLFCIGSASWEGVDEYFGARMFWSEYDLDTALQLVKDAGIRIISGRFLKVGEEKHFWIIARNKKQYDSFMNACHEAVTRARKSLGIVLAFVELKC
jgi:ubiquinone/menaquinone biosynthesis C-methylase UbiE